MDSDYSAARLPPSSSALVALSTLSPPSPRLTASLVSTSITSGDIPILLDGLEFCANHRDSTASGFSDRRISRRVSFYESSLPQSGSSASTGTFGPKCSRPPSAYRQLWENHIKEVKPFMAIALRSQTRMESQGRVPSYTATQEVPVTMVKHYSGGDISEVPATVVDPKTLNQNEQLTSSPTNHGPYDVSTNASTMAPVFKSKPVAYLAPPGGKRRSTFSLDNIRMTISIDQEGFRSVNPSFRFVGLCKRIFDDKRQPAENMARFMPVNQQTFHFHYAPFDGLPVLRRISVNEDETRDYISRDATLGLKSNGIYVVHGIELATQTMHEENQGYSTLELHWEFVYKVDDRKIGPAKKIINGEKNLTPLSLSCSPALLNPSQGKRVNLLHVVRKSITAKLTAEKVEASEHQVVSPLPVEVPSAGVPLFDTTNSGFGGHRRAISCGRRPELTTSNPMPPEQRDVLQENRCDIHDHDLSSGARRRRASSAGEWNGFDPQPPIQKHIVSPARLAQMLETKSIKTPTTPQIDFYPLTPNPRHYRSRERSGAGREK